MTPKPIDREAVYELHPRARLLAKNGEPLNEEEFRATLVSDAAEARRMMEYCVQVYWSRVANNPQTAEFVAAREGLVNIRDYLRLFAINLETILERGGPEDE